MSTRLLAELEADIWKWINNNCEADDWPETQVYGELSEDMAKAAMLVFQASMRGQRYAKEQS